MNPARNQSKETLIDEIIKSIESVRYGYVQIIIQNSKVVQINKMEKIRLDKKGGGIEDNNLG